MKRLIVSKTIFVKTICVFVLLLSLQVLNVLPASADQHQPTKILVLGDSLSAAYKLAESSGWVHILEEQLKNENYAAEVYNVSVSGATTATGKQLLPGALAQFNPDLVILELGANDGLQGKPIDYIGANLSNLIITVKNAGADVLLLGVRLPPNRGKRYIEPFYQQYSQLSSRYETGLVPFFLDGVAGNTALMMADGLHPNAEGQKVIAELMYPHLKSYLDNRHFPHLEGTEK